MRSIDIFLIGIMYFQTFSVMDMLFREFPILKIGHRNGACQQQSTFTLTVLGAKMENACRLMENISGIPAYNNVQENILHLSQIV